VDYICVVCGLLLHVAKKEQKWQLHKNGYPLHEP